MVVAVAAFTVIGDFNVFSNKASWENGFEFFDKSIRKLDIYYFSTFFTIKVGMLR